MDGVLKTWDHPRKGRIEGVVVSSAAGYATIRTVEGAVVFAAESQLTEVHERRAD